MKGQFQVVYLALFVLFGLIFLGFVFFLSQDIEESGGKEISELLIEDTLVRIERSIVELKYLDNQTDVGSSVKKIGIPKRIGDNYYTITAENSTLTFSLHGDNALLRTRVIKVWDAEIGGLVYSSNGVVKINYTSGASPEIVLS